MVWYDGGHVSYLWEDDVEQLVLEALRRGGLVEAERPRLRVVPGSGS